MWPFEIHQPSPHDFPAQSDNIVLKTKESLPESLQGPHWVHSKRSENCC